MYFVHLGPKIPKPPRKCVPVGEKFRSSLQNVWMYDIWAKSTEISYQKRVWQSFNHSANLIVAEK